MEKQFSLFNINDAYLFMAGSGMDSAVPLTGRPYGGCLYKVVCNLCSAFYNGSSLLLVNVYFPIDDGSAARRRYKVVCNLCSAF